MLESQLNLSTISRSSRPEVFCIKDVLKHFVKFKVKRLCQSIFLNKVAGLKNTFFYRTPLLTASVYHGESLVTLDFDAVFCLTLPQGVIYVRKFHTGKTIAGYSD